MAPREEADHAEGLVKVKIREGKANSQLWGKEAKGTRAGKVAKIWVWAWVWVVPEVLARVRAVVMIDAHRRRVI